MIPTKRGKQSNWGEGKEWIGPRNLVRLGLEGEESKCDWELVGVDTDWLGKETGSWMRGETGTWSWGG